MDHQTKIAEEVSLKKGSFEISTSICSEVNENENTIINQRTTAAVAAAAAVVVVETVVVVAVGAAVAAAAAVVVCSMTADASAK